MTRTIDENWSEQAAWSDVTKNHARAISRLRRADAFDASLADLSKRIHQRIIHRGLVSRMWDPSQNEVKE